MAPAPQPTVHPAGPHLIMTHPRRPWRRSSEHRPCAPCLPGPFQCDTTSRSGSLQSFTFPVYPVRIAVLLPALIVFAAVPMTFDGLAADQAWTAATVLLQVATLAQTLQVVWVVMAPVSILMVDVDIARAATPFARPLGLELSGPFMSGAPVRLSIWHFRLLKGCGHTVRVAILPGLPI
jgi:hypothetical protein